MYTRTYLLYYTTCMLLGDKNALLITFTIWYRLRYKLLLPFRGVRVAVGIYFEVYVMHLLVCVAACILTTSWESVQQYIALDPYKEDIAANAWQYAPGKNARSRGAHVPEHHAWRRHLCNNRLTLSIIQYVYSLKCQFCFETGELNTYVYDRRGLHRRKYV